MSVHKESFGQLDNGTSVQKFILTNKNGMIVELIDYGATIVAIKVPNKDKSLTDVTLGFDNIGGYLSTLVYLINVMITTPLHRQK